MTFPNEEKTIQVFVQLSFSLTTTTTSITSINDDDGKQFTLLVNGVGVMDLGLESLSSWNGVRRIFFRRRSTFLGVVVILLTVYHFVRDFKVRTIGGTATMTATNKVTTTARSSTPSSPSSSSQEPIIVDMELLLQRSQARERNEQQQMPTITTTSSLSDSTARGRSQQSTIDTSVMNDTAKAALPPIKRPMNHTLSPPLPSFNFTITELDDGCGNVTVPSNVRAKFSKFSKEIPFIDYVDILQAGSNPALVTTTNTTTGEITQKGVAMCKLRR